MLTLAVLDGCKDWGILLLRVGIGLMFIVVHGGPKLLGGKKHWTQIGIAAGGG